VPTPTLYASTDQRNLARLPRELWRSRELLLDLVRKDLRARYRYAAAGFLWAVIEPLGLMLLLTFVFSFVFDIRGIGGDAETPFAAVLLCGLVFWNFTAYGVGAATHSIVESRNLVQKVNLTREVLPIAALGYPLVNLGIGLTLLLCVHIILGGGLSLALLALVPVFAIQLALTAGAGMLLAWANARFRDIGYIVGVALIFGFYASPVFYPLAFVFDAERIPGWMQSLYLVNPMAELLTAYRQIILEYRLPDAWLLVWPAVLAFVFCVVGFVSFRRAAPTLSDYL